MCVSLVHKWYKKFPPCLFWQVDDCGRRVDFPATSESGSEAVAYVPVDQAGNVITLTASGGGPARPEMLTEDELDYGIAPDSTSTPLKPPDEEYLRVSWIMDLLESDH